MRFASVAQLVEHLICNQGMVWVRVLPLALEVTHESD